MAKDEFIGIRVSKEFKKLVQGEAKRKGVSLSEYIEKHSDYSFKLTKQHIKTLLERTKEDLPTFWSEADKYRITKEFEDFILMVTTDFLMPINTGKPSLHPVHMLTFIPMILKNTIVNIDAVDDEYKLMAARKFLNAGQILAENLNKLKTKDSEQQKHIISEMKNIIETFVFYFTSMAFEKDAFVKIKAELDKTEKTLIKDIDKATK
ncbi:MAG: hypothetical protein ACOYU2_04305 [Nitrospirota bacterium]